MRKRHFAGNLYLDVRVLRGVYDIDEIFGLTKPKTMHLMLVAVTGLEPATREKTAKPSHENY